MVTQPTDVDVDAYLAALPTARRRDEGAETVAIMREATGVEPRMWGPSMIGFGEFHYDYASGHSGDTFVLGFAPRSTSLVLYGLIPPADEEAILDDLGPHERSKGCLYVKRLEALDRDVLRALVARAWAAQGTWGP